MRFHDSDAPFPPSMNDGKHVFVFGSNLPGRHGAGAALTARLCWGASNGFGVGHCGQSYAIPTKGERIETLPLPIIAHHVAHFIIYATQHPELTFLVTPIGTGLAGYSHEDIAPMFKDVPENCILPKVWERILKP